MRRQSRRRAQSWRPLSRRAASEPIRVECRRFEVPASPAASSFRNFKSISGTRIKYLLVPLCFRSSCEGVSRCVTNFGNGALVVGTILNLINQGDALFGPGPINWVKVLLTYLVPYTVSTYGAVSYRL